MPWEINEFRGLDPQHLEEDSVGVLGVPAPPMISFYEFYQQVFDMKPPPVVHFAQGGQFAASAEAIRRTPKHKHQYVLDMIEAGHEEFVYCEASWYAFMHGPTHPMHVLQEDKAF